MNFFIWRLPVVFMMTVLLSRTLPAAIGDPDSGQKSNFEVIRLLTEKLTDELLIESKIHLPASISFRCREFQDAWLASQIISSKIKNSGYRLFYGTDTVTPGNKLLSIDNLDVSVRYDTVFRDRLFGSAKVKRRITIGVYAQIVERANGEVLFSGGLTDSHSDTVAVGDIPRLEKSASGSTYGNIPEDMFIDRFIEPFVLIGAAGVVVFLFFHVRTQ